MFGVIARAHKYADSISAYSSALAQGMESSSEASSSFQWHHRELQLLSSFVEEQEEWLDSVLTSLQWSREGLLAGGQVCAHESSTCVYVCFFVYTLQSECI